MAKFWGLTVNVGKKFKQQVQESFCISGAALEPLDLASGRFDEKPVLLYLQQDQNDFLLCSLAPKQSVLQVPLNVRIGSGETVGFHLKGGSPKTKVHLTGYTLQRGDSSSASPSPGSQVPFKGQQRSILVTEPKSADKQKKRVSIVENEPYGEREELESDEDTEAALQGLGKDATKNLFNGNLGDDSDEDDDDFEFDDDDDDDDDDSDENDEEMEELRQMAMKGKYNPKTGGKMGEDEDSDDLEVLEEEEEEEDDDDDDEDEDDSEDDKKASPKKTQQQKSPESKSPQKQKQAGSNANTPTGKDKKKGDSNSSAQNTPTKTPENKNLNNLNVKTPSSAGHTPMKSFSKGGVLVNDVKLGNGQKAKLGKMVTVYYEGRLKSNNKRFDATQNGPGFKFRLGKGEVIRGWDLGIEGMKIGGKRRLVIPAQLAYGKSGAPPDIPPNSTLVFDVELKNVS